ncbi:MAG: hypothetical protein LKE40_00485 [Spirochaetia bacterium]|nr:hypothetical protein [Spirochaetia bacterium]
MKQFQMRLLIAITFFCIAMQSVSASASYKLFGGNVIFEPVPVNPLFREPLADPFSDSSSFRRLVVTDDTSAPRDVFVSNDGSYERIAFEDDDPDHTAYWQMKSAVNIGFLRFTSGPFQMEGYLRGGINTVFEGFGSVDCMGFDGMYGAGITVKLYRKLAFRAGFHHFSGHWGDEILEDLETYNPDATYDKLLEYTRGNTLQAAVSFEPTMWTRFYAMADLPMQHSWIRPGLFVPSYVLKPGNFESQFTNITEGEGLSAIPYDSSYRAWIIELGAEQRFPVSSLGSVFLACDVKFHQDGQTQATTGGSYSPGNPWEQEYTIGGGFEFNQTQLGRKVRLEAYYHDGRFPLLNYFFQRSRYIVFGIAING